MTRDSRKRAESPLLQVRRNGKEKSGLMFKKKNKTTFVNGGVSSGLGLDIDRQ